MMLEGAKNIPTTISLGKKIAYGAMGSAVAASSLLAGTCISRCNGCMGCLVGGTGIIGIIVGSKMVLRFSGHGKGEAVPEAGDEIENKNNKDGIKHEN